jgi:nucleoid-associated protein YgaU
MAAMRTQSSPAIPTAMLVGVVVAACIPSTFGRPGATVIRPTASPPVAAETEAAPTIGPSVRPSFVRPTPTPQPTFLSYVVKRGDTLTSIALAHGTTARSIAFWNRIQHPSLDPDSPNYSPNRIEVGWILLLVPDLELDPEDLPPEPTPASATPPASLTP